MEQQEPFVFELIPTDEDKIRLVESKGYRGFAKVEALVPREAIAATLSAMGESLDCALRLERDTGLIQRNEDEDGADDTPGPYFWLEGTGECDGDDYVGFGVWPGGIRVLLFKGESGATRLIEPPLDDVGFKSFQVALRWVQANARVYRLEAPLPAQDGYRPICEAFTTFLHACTKRNDCPDVLHRLYQEECYGTYYERYGEIRPLLGLTKSGAEAAIQWARNLPEWEDYQHAATEMVKAAEAEVKAEMEAETDPGVQWVGEAWDWSVEGTLIPLRSFSSSGLDRFDIETMQKKPEGE